MTERPETLDRQSPLRIALLAMPETSGSVLYGLYDVFLTVGRLWPELTGEGEARELTSVDIVSRDGRSFHCAGAVPVEPQAALAEAEGFDVVIVPDFVVALDEDPRGRRPEAVEWLRHRYRDGAILCSVCSGSLLLAETGLLEGEAATTHWGVASLFRYFPEIRLCPERLLVPAGPGHRLITTGGVASWEDLAVYLVHRFCGAEEAIRLTKLHLFGDRGTSQLPYAAMVRRDRRDDAAIAEAQAWIADNYARANPVTELVRRSGLPERTFKRRFRAATGYTPIDYVQTLRIEEAKQLLETGDLPVERIGPAVGYDDPAFFRRLFKRRTGLTPAAYRRKFRPHVAPPRAEFAPTSRRA